MHVQAAVPQPENPQSGSVGLSGTVSSAPPTQAATIATPSNGAVFTNLPVTVAGLCKTDLLMKVFDNGIFVGAVNCVNGSYSLQIDLFSGRNELVTRVYDGLDQAGPDSNVVTVTFNDGQFTAFGGRVNLTSDFARRGADPNTELTWPIIVSNGSAPYALSVDWGDGTAIDLLSQANAGTLTIRHTYKSAGIYRIIIKATDKNGGIAYLQLIGVANGQIAAATSTQTINGSSQTITQSKWIWWPVLLTIPFALIAFWLGRRHELYTLRRTLERHRTA